MRLERRESQSLTRAASSFHCRRSGKFKIVPEVVKFCLSDELFKELDGIIAELAQDGTLGQGAQKVRDEACIACSHWSGAKKESDGQDCRTEAMVETSISRLSPLAHCPWLCLPPSFCVSL